MDINSEHKDIMLLAKYLDHASIATTQRYVDQLMLKEEKTFNMDCLYILHQYDQHLENCSTT